MNLTFFLGITAAMTIVIAGSSLGLDFVSAQMADNATMGNLTGGNMTMEMGNMTESNSTESGKISGVGGLL
jgi:hypothetical protein